MFGYRENTQTTEDLTLNVDDEETKKERETRNAYVHLFCLDTKKNSYKRNK